MSRSGWIKRFEPLDREKLLDNVLETEKWLEKSSQFQSDEIFKRPENAGKNIVAMLADNGMKCLSTNMYSLTNKVMQENFSKIQKLLTCQGHSNKLRNITCENGELP